MNAELEALIRAYDVAKQTPGAEGKRLRAIFQARMDDTLEKHPNLAAATLKRMVQVAHIRWIKAGEQFPSLPPKA
jgi:hypothetical protein